VERVRKDDQVRVRSGKDRGRVGRVVRVYPGKGRVLVEGVNIVTKHERLRPGGPGSPQEGGIIQTEAPVDISNVQLVCPRCEEPPRVGFRYEEEGDRLSKIRFCKKCDATF
jgi:large subunit ribosomal protein L24